MNNPYLNLDVPGTVHCLWEYQVGGSRKRLKIAPPVFRVDGQAIPATLKDIAPLRRPARLRNGVTEHVLAGTLQADAGLALEMVFRVARDNPVVRFRYTLKARDGRARALTKLAGRDDLTYLRLPLKLWPDCTEVQLSAFDESIHSFRLRELPVTEQEFAQAVPRFGPILTASDGRHSMLVAYEHGSQVPDAFVQFQLQPDGQVSLCGVKGNYCSDQLLPYETIWMELGAVAGDRAALASAYRQFVLQYQMQNAASRQPFIFYSTWAFQERNKWWNSKRYLDSMNQERMLAEIEVAHRMGIEVFVIDTGWYQKTGDWRVNRDRFPDGLKAVRERLSRHEMKLGLWFSPTQAALTSRMHAGHRDCVMSWQGRENPPVEVWETEPSQCLCLVSRYWEAFADELIRLVKEVGVTYFKWDAIGQYGCDDPRHLHGGHAVTPSERADAYAFEQVRYMVCIIDRLCAACPEAIVDFDVTESGRSMGLAFLSAGKYFLINNGPYYPNFDVPHDWKTTTTWSNIFVHPGPARGWFCRSPLSFDTWIPSVLFLTHYLPDDPDESQLINIASLILGQNGIWGDLLSVSEAGVQRFAQLLGFYRQVRDDIVRSNPHRLGSPGTSPEIHEKISHANGRGAVVIFANTPGQYRYVTANRVIRTYWATEGVAVKRGKTGHAEITTTFEKPGARIVFFGIHR